MMSWLIFGLTSGCVRDIRMLSRSCCASSWTCLLTCASAPVASRRDSPREMLSTQAGRQTDLIDWCRVGRRLCLLLLLTRTTLLLTGMLLLGMLPLGMVMMACGR